MGFMGLMGLVVLMTGMLMIVVLAAAVLAYVMFPHRNLRPRHGHWATEVLADAADRVRPHGPVPVHGLWVDPQRDLELRGRLDTIERVVTIGLTRKGMPAREA
jgi:hypothetical protein